MARGAVRTSEREEEEEGEDEEEEFFDHYKKRDLIRDPKRHGRLAVAWDRHGSPVPRCTLTRYGMDNTLHLQRGGGEREGAQKQTRVESPDRINTESKHQGARKSQGLPEALYMIHDIYV
jgi:hypothetical protein